MLQISTPHRHNDITIISDIISFKNLYLLRTKNQLIALSDVNLEITWSLEIEGETKINLDTIHVCNDLIFLFSFNKESEEYFIFGIDNLGNIVWKTICEYRPHNKYGIISYNGQITYLGYNNISDNFHVISINSVNGNLEGNLDVQISVNYLLNIQDNIILAGSDGVFFLDEKLTQFSNEYIDSIVPLQNEYLFVSQAKKTGCFNVNILELAEYQLIKIGDINLDTSDRTFMAPIAISKEELLLLSGDNLGVCLQNIASKKVIWEIGKEKWTCLKVVENNKLVLMMTEDEDFESDVLIFPLKDKDNLERINYEGVPSSIFLQRDHIFITGLTGLQIFRIQQSTLKN